MAMDQEVTEIVASIAAEGQDRLDVPLLRQNDAGGGLDRVVKMERCAPMRVESRERRRLGPIGVEDRQDVSDAPSAMTVEFVKAANGQRGEGKGLHAGSGNTKTARRRFRFALVSVREQHRRSHVREDVSRAGAVAE